MSVWNSYTSLTKALATVFENPDNHDNDEVLEVIEKFVILVYERTSDLSEVNEARRRMFAHKSSLENIPPTKAALIQHWKRSVYQGKGTTHHSL